MDASQNKATIYDLLSQVLENNKANPQWSRRAGGPGRRPRDDARPFAPQQLGPCKAQAIELVKNNKDLTLMVGPNSPESFRGDTQHFWAQNKQGEPVEDTDLNYPHYAQGIPLNLEENPDIASQLDSTESD